MKVLFVFGTRPEAIKMAPLVRELLERARDGAAVQPRVCVTGQHREMLDQVLEFFEIAPDHDLNLMQPGQGLFEISAKALTALKPVLEQEAPDWVLVQGDTTTAMIAALAGFYVQAKVGHVEAGLRSFRKDAPFPEEVNRRVAGVVTDLHFAPTAQARDNLLREATAPASIRVTGNTVIDAIQWAAKKADPALVEGLLPQLAEGQKLVLMTCHRRENFGEPARRILESVRAVAGSREDAHVLYPVHPNPRILEPAREILGGADRVTLCEPLEYGAMAAALAKAHCVVTDSGGIQEEAPGLGKPVLVFREVTERPEGVASGTVELVGSDREKIVGGMNDLLDGGERYQRMARATNPYGDGLAAKRIADALLGVPTDDFAS
jgi:UDP-N-acetylglucosamine 2-epimerase (non-hydrolysing)